MTKRIKLCFAVYIPADIKNGPKQYLFGRKLPVDLYEGETLHSAIQRGMDDIMRRVQDSKLTPHPTQKGSIHETDLRPTGDTCLMEGAGSEPVEADGQLPG